MIIRPLGHSDLQVSALGLGGNTFGPPRIGPETATQVIHAALDAGINFIDTAIMYGQGESESIIGQALTGRRDQVVLATKFNFLTLEGADPRQRIRDHCEESLRKLQTDRIDLYQLHTPSDEISTEDLLLTLSELQQAGKIRSYGASNYAAWRLAESDFVARQLGVPRFVTVQNQYSLLHRRPEQELAQALERYEVSLIPYHPLAGGYLTGKYRPGQPPPPGTRGAAGSIIVDHVSSPSNWAIVESLTAFAEARGHTVGELAIAWLVAKPFVGSVITGLSNVEQLQQNLSGAEWILTDDEVAEVDRLSDTGGSAPTEGYVSQRQRQQQAQR